MIYYSCLSEKNAKYSKIHMQHVSKYHISFPVKFGNSTHGGTGYSNGTLPSYCQLINMKSIKENTHHTSGCVWYDIEFVCDEHYWSTTNGGKWHQGRAAFQGMFTPVWMQSNREILGNTYMKILALGVSICSLSCMSMRPTFHLGVGTYYPSRTLNLLWRTAYNHRYHNMYLKYDTET